MTILQTLLPEFDHEMSGTRKTLARVPWDEREWRPHPKSYTLGHLAGHLAEIASWGSFTLETDELDFATFEYKPPQHASVEALLATFDGYVAKSRAALERADDATARSPWTMRQGEQIFFTLPKVAVREASPDASAEASPESAPESDEAAAPPPAGEPA